LIHKWNGVTVRVCLCQKKLTLKFDHSSTTNIPAVGQLCCFALSYPDFETLWRKGNNQISLTIGSRMQLANKNPQQ
jgi:hypothetical protein